MDRKLRWLVYGAAFMAMGISMPSCPGQQAMQQQIDSLQASNSELTRRVQALDTQVRSLNKDMEISKQIAQQMSTLLTAQKTTLENMAAAVTALQARAASQTSHTSKAPRGKTKTRR